MRELGLFVGLELVKNRTTREPILIGNVLELPRGRLFHDLEGADLSGIVMVQPRGREDEVPEPIARQVHEINAGFPAPGKRG